MGANGVVQVLKGTTLKETFQHAQNTDRMENGSSYSGGIGMASGYRVVSNPVPQYDAVRLGEHLLHDEVKGPQKWGEAFIIPVLPTTKQRTIKIEVDITGLKFQDVEPTIAAAAKMKMRPGEVIDNVQFNGLGRQSASIEQQGTKTTKVVKTVGTGPLNKVYIVVVGGAFRAEINKTFNTLAEANAWAEGEAARSYGDELVRVYAMQRRESGPLYSYKKVVTKETVFAHVVVGIPQGTPASWVAVGVYSC